MSISFYEQTALDSTDGPYSYSNIKGKVSHKIVSDGRINFFLFF